MLYFLRIKVHNNEPFIKLLCSFYEFIYNRKRGGIMMKKKVFALVAAAACVSSFAFAIPQTQFEQGQWQLDLGAWNPKAEVDSNDLFGADGAGDISTDSKWNFQGGLSYAFTNRLALQYNYYGLKTDGSNETGNVGTDGDEHEVNLVYSLNKNFAVYAGWNRIKNDLDGLNWSDTNNVAQIGLIAKAPLAKNLDFYAKGAVGTKDTALWEAGLGYTIGDNWDINAGYRYLNTKLADGNGELPVDDTNITYKGFIAGVSYRFGGGHKEAPAPEPVYTPAPEPAPVVETPAPAPRNDYYFESIHFGFDEDQPLPSEQQKLENFVATAKANPTDTFKLVGNTDSKGTNAYNEGLSQRRVDNVAAYAESKGVPASQMKLEYKGDTDPVATNATAAGRADNRRVDIWQNK